MFDLGPEKILVVMVFALVIFGPQRLPEIARSIGAALRTVRGMQDEVRGQLSATLNGDSETTPPQLAAVEPATPPEIDDPADGASFV